MPEDYDLLSWFQEDQEAEVEYRVFDNGPYEGYKIGSDGTVWTCWRTSGHAQYIKRWLVEDYEIVIPVIKKGKNYLYVMVNCKPIYLHKLILEVFYGPCPEGLEGLHKDGNKYNNSKSNLKWGTHDENMKDCVRHGSSTTGSRSSTSKLTAEQVILIRELKDKGWKRRNIVAKIQETSDELITIQMIDDVTNRKTWSNI